jgi:hypothetical protein
MVANLIVGIALMSAWAATAEPCDELSAQLQSRLEITKLAMEPESALAAIYQRATEARVRCAANESLAYLRLRAAELGRGASVGREPSFARDEWHAMAHELSARFPASVRIATVQARASGTVADARRAVALQASYAPAQVALASALSTVDPNEAAACLAGVKNLGVVSDGYTVLARVRFARHDLNGAIEAARRALRGREVDLIEPDGRGPRPVSGAHEILGLAYLEKGAFHKAAQHLRLASADSEKARTILADPPPRLRQALPPARRRPVDQ